MKLTCSSEKLKNALAHADRVTGKNLTLPILSSILCIASDSKLKLRATNLNLGIEIEIPAKVEKEGVIAVPGTLLSGFFANNKTKEDVSLELQGQTLVVKTKQGKVQIKTLPYEDFPSIPVVEGAHVKLEANALVSGLTSVYYACAQTETKPEIASVSIFDEDNTLTFVATDSFRLAEKKIKLKNNYGFQPVLLPYKNTVELLRILSDVSGDIELVISKNLLAISFGGYYITSRIVDGAFPDYRQILPKSHTTEAVVLKSELQDAIKTGALFTDKFNQITISIDPAQKKFILSAKNTDVGENETALDAALKGEAITTTINCRYLLDCLNAITVDSISIECMAENRPLTIRGVGDTSYLYLIMPMNR